jgi:hypothetical protein
VFEHRSGPFFVYFCALLRFRYSRHISSVILLTLRLSRTACILIFSRSAGSTVRVAFCFGMVREYNYTCTRINHFVHIFRTPC